jgi:hypothetical protein
MQRININSITLGDKRAVFINHKKHSLWYPNMVGHVFYTNLEDARKDQAAYNEFLTLAMYECYDFNARLFTLYNRVIGYKENTYSNTKFFEVY